MDEMRFNIKKLVVQFHILEIRTELNLNETDYGCYH